MKKLRLELDDLRVDSFSTSFSEDAAGTVRGHDQPSWDEPCEPIPPDETNECPPYTQGASCVSCVNTCFNSCYGSCQATCYTCWQATCANATCHPCYPQEPTG